MLEESETSMRSDDKELVASYMEKYSQGVMHDKVMPICFSNGSKITEMNGTCGCGAPYDTRNISFYKLSGFRKEEKGYQYYNMETYRACPSCRTIDRCLLHAYANDYGFFTIERLFKGKVVERTEYYSKKYKPKKSFLSYVLVILKKILLPFSK